MSFRSVLVAARFGQGYIYIPGNRRRRQRTTSRTNTSRLVPFYSRFVAVHDVSQEPVEEDDERHQECHREHSVPIGAPRVVDSAIRHDGGTSLAVVTPPSLQQTGQEGQESVMAHKAAVEAAAAATDRYQVSVSPDHSKDSDSNSHGANIWSVVPAF